MSDDPPDDSGVGGSGVSLLTRVSGCWYEGDSGPVHARNVTCLRKLSGECGCGSDVDKSLCGRYIEICSLTVTNHGGYDIRT